jgi:hypothetical protein
MDQGMAANHHLEVQISQAATGSVVMDVTPTIRLTDKLTGTSRDLPQVMGMYGATMDPSDFHYGQNLFLSDGTYSVTVLVGPSDTAQFRDVVVMASPMMADRSMSRDMAMAHDMSMAAGTARDGRVFSTEPAATQALFTSVWVRSSSTTQRSRPREALSALRPNSWLPVRGVRTALCLGQIRNSTDGAH